MAEGEPGQGDAGDFGHWQRRAHRRGLLSKRHRHPLSVRTLSRAGSAMVALLASPVDMMIDVPTSSSLPHVRSGGIKAYAVMSKTRIASAPDIPTVDEVAARVLCMVWYGLW